MSDQQVKPKRPHEQPVDVSLKNSSRAMGILERKWSTALVFSIFFGWMGLDAFYLGKTGKGILKLFTLGLFGVLWIIDIIMIATKSVRGVVWKESDPNKSWISQNRAVVVVLVIVGLGFITAVSSGGNTNTNSDKKSSSKQYRFADRADKQEKDTEVLVSEPATIDGVKMSISSANYSSKIGEFSEAKSDSNFLVAEVKLENTGDKTKPYNVFDFRIQTSGGQVLDGTFELLDKPLNSGDLVAGGSVSGQIVFEVPIEEGHQYIIWKPGFASDRAIVQVK